MSEFQYYDFLAIDAPLSKEAKTELRRLSSRAEISSTRFINEYEYGDFKGEPRELMARWFDAHVYLTNWGTYSLLLAIPQQFVDKALWRRYLPEDRLYVATANKRVVISLTMQEDGGDYVDETGQWMGRLSPVRDEIISGDLRPLYLGWLAAGLSGDVREEEVEPPVPAGLKDLTSAQKALARYLQLDKALLKEAARRSEPRKAGGSCKTWVEALPVERLRKLAIDLIEGESAKSAETTARAFIREYSRTAIDIQTVPGERTLGALLESLG